MRDPFIDFLRRPSRRRFALFVEAYIDPLTRLADRLIPDPAAADDLVQDSFLRLGAARLRPGEVRSPRAYVFRTLVNLALDRLREDTARARHEEEAARMRGRRFAPTPEAEAMSRESVEQVYEAIGRLPEEFRTAIHLRAVEGLSYADISQVTGVPQDTVGTRIHRAREELRKLLGGTALAAGLAGLERARAAGALPGASEQVLTQILGRGSTGLKCGGETASTLERGIRPATILWKASISGSLLVVGLLAFFVVRSGRSALQRGNGDSAEHAPANPPATDAPVLEPEDMPGAPASPWSRPFRIRGRLVDASDRSPISMRTCVLASQGSPPARSSTDANGRFSSILPRAIQDSITVKVRGYRWRTRHLPIESIEDRFEGLDLGEVPIERGIEIRFRVTDPDDRPIPGARVSVRSPEWHWDEAFGQPEETDHNGIWARAGFHQDVQTILSVSASGYVHTEVEVWPFCDSGPVGVILEPAAEVRGKLAAPGGDGVPGIEVWLEGYTMSDPDRFRHRQGYFHSTLAVTDGAGAFRVSCPIGRTLPLRFDRWSDVRVNIPPLGRGEVRDLGAITNPNSILARVCVVDPEGTPVPACRVVLVQKRQGSWDFWRAQRWTDADGRTEISVVGTGEYGLQVCDRRFVVQEPVPLPDPDDAPLEPGNRRPSEIRLTAQVGRVLRGCLLDAWMRPAPWAYVVCRGSSMGSAHPDRDGVFFLPGCPAPPLRLFLHCWDTFESIVEEIPEREILDLVLPVPSWPILRVQVFDIDGRPASDGPCHARLIFAGNSYQCCSTTLRGGEAIFHTFGRECESRPSPPRIVIIQPEVGATRPLTAGPPVDRLIDMEAHLEPLGSMVGEIADPDGDPIGGAMVFHEWRQIAPDLEYLNIFKERAIYTDEMGRFRIAHLLPGRYRLWAYARGKTGGWSEPIEVSSGEEANVTLRLPPGGAIRGVVLDGGGHPVENVAIRAQIPGLGGQAFPVFPLTAADGKFLIDGLPSGTIHVLVSASDDHHKSFSAQITAGETTWVEVRLSQ